MTGDFVLAADQQMKRSESKSSGSQRSAKKFRTVDIENLETANPNASIKEFEFESKPSVVKCDLLIVGGGMGGVAAAIAACKEGLNVCLTEQTSWLGGQMTSQGVSALDENALVETSGATKLYKTFRQSIRDYYLSIGAKDGAGLFSPYIDPGDCWVSRLAFEPKVALEQLGKLLSPYVESQQLKILTRHAPAFIRKSRGRITALQCADLDSKKLTEFRFKFCIDATELGDLLPLAGIEYSSGAESREQTGEAHAPLSANVENVQDFTYPFVVEFCPGENHLIEKPPHYDEFKEAGKFSLFGYRFFENSVVINEAGRQYEFLPFWEYRRLINKNRFNGTKYPHDISMINWESNDLRGENIIDKSPETMAERLALGKSLSMGFLYWLQTEVQRDDGGKGYPELKLRADTLGTADGVSKFPYIRESRRIKSQYTIVESDITKAQNPGARAKVFQDAMGIGLYPVDIHGKQDIPGAGQATSPFQIPAASLIQTQVRNLLPACKNIGTTHVSNGAYRLHPIEWAIGEAAGVFAAEAFQRHTDLPRLLQNKRGLRSVQDKLARAGAPLFWYDDICPEDEDFAPVQFISVCSLIAISQDDLHFRPDDPISRADLSYSLARLLHLPRVEDSALNINDMQEDNNCFPAVMSCLTAGLLKLNDRNEFLPSESITVAELNAIAQNKLIKAARLKGEGIISRRMFARWLYSLAKQERFFGRH